MLDIQRHSPSSVREEVHFARWVLWAHMGLGGLSILLLSFHFLLLPTLSALCWYSATLVLLLSQLRGFGLKRFFLGCLFGVYALAGVVYLMRFQPQQIGSGLLPAGFLPFWLGFFNLAYLGLAYIMFCSTRIQRASQVQFKLWPLVRP
jgi:hypothetical protein